MDNVTTLRVGVVQWSQNGGVSSMIVDALREVGYPHVTLFGFDAPLPPALDVVVVCGPLGSLVPLVNQIMAQKRDRRPVVALWMTEQFPHPDLPRWFLRAVGTMRSWAERALYRKNGRHQWEVRRYGRWLTNRLHRYRYYGDLYWLAGLDTPFVLATGSRWICARLRESGFDAIEAYFGYHAGWGEDLALERDIPVLWLGKPGSKRRRRLLQQVRKALRERGVEMHVVDGEENPYVFGEARTVLLNRSKIVLNLLRTKWDNNAFRYYLSAPNRALVITEPTLPHTPFTPGIHIIESPVDLLPDAICHFLNNEAERQQITERAYQLATAELTLEKGVCLLLQKATAVLSANTR